MIFADRSNSYVAMTVAPESANNRGRHYFTDAGLEWNLDGFHVSVSGMSDGAPHGKEFLREIALALDPEFQQACVVESFSGEGSPPAQFAVSPPEPPPGFVKRGSYSSFTRATQGCDNATVNRPPVFDFTWEFGNDRGDVIRAGVYKYEDSFEATAIGPRRFHWAGSDGRRFWVAASGATEAEGLENQLHHVAESLDPGFGF